MRSTDVKCNSPCKWLRSVLEWPGVTELRGRTQGWVANDVLEGAWGISSLPLLDCSF